jgi:uncharacterized protein (DUF1800 family)
LRLTIAPDLPITGWCPSRKDPSVPLSPTAGEARRSSHRHTRRASRGSLPVYSGPFGAVQAERLLWRAGFGPRPGEPQQLAALGLRGAVLSLTRPAPATLQGPAPVTQSGQPIEPYEVYGHDVLWWLDRMVRTTAPLVERMTLLWHDWFATSEQGVGSPALMLDQNATLRRLSLGSFDALLRAVTVDPAMLLFLSGARNTRAAPNENYAREMQELFTLGVGAYSERDVREHARALTGWTCTWNPAARRNENFRYDSSLHDGGVKSIYGHRGRFGWRDSVRLALAHPAHPRYFVARLWSYFSPAPLPAAHARAAERLYVSSGLAIRPVLEALLLHPLVHAGPRMVKPPVVQIAGMLRAIGRFIDTDEWIWASTIAGQLPFYPPNVAGWDATRWLNTGTWLARFNLASSMIGEQRALVPELAKDAVPVQARALVEEACAFWGSPTLSAATQGVLLAYAAAAVGAATHQWQSEQFPVLALNALRTLVVATPDYHTS